MAGASAFRLVALSGIADLWSSQMVAVDGARLHVVYRIAPERPSKPRPAPYSQELALLSFLTSLYRARTLLRTEVTFIVDGPVCPQLVDICSALGRVGSVDYRSNPLSFRTSLDEALASAAEFVYLAEDDYMYCADAFSVLAAALDRLPQDVDYLTLYDHPDRYRASADLDHRAHSLYFVGLRHWVSVESTCLTFMARSAALRRDHHLFLLGTAKTPPWDRAIWRAVLFGRRARLILWGLHGSARFTMQVLPRLLRSARHGGSIRLISPVPGLAVHGMVNGLSPGVPWAGLVEATLEASKQWPELDGLRRIAVARMSGSVGAYGRSD